jgi:L-rhamnose mutarotase
MTYHTTIYLSEDHKKWIDEMSLNVSKYVRSLIDRDMQRWKQITEDILIPIVKTEKQLEEKQKTGLDEMFHD